jgi:ABC-2 type transport system ATP-binding protein
MSMDTPDSILRTTQLTKRFGKRYAVRNLDLDVRRGDIYGFLGPNGAGKSTTIRMVLSLIRPTAGSVALLGADIARDRSVLGRVGGLVEKPDFYLYLSGRRNLETVAALYGTIPAKRIDEVLEIVGLGDRGGDRVKAYSHGMKQRLGIAQALLPNPELLILDEPTNGLDPQGMKEVRELIRRLNAEQGMTIFLSSHLLSEIERVATRMCILNFGELIVQGTVKELLGRRPIRVRIAAEPREQAMTLLGNMAWATELVEVENEIECLLPEERLAETNTLLVQAGVAVSGFFTRRSLEEFFLSKTELPDSPAGV